MSGKSKLFHVHSQEAARLYAAGLTTQEIGGKFGVTGWCINRWLEKLGVPRRAARDYYPSDVERFWSYVVRKGADECWGWTNTTRDGYGRLHYGGVLSNANRISWILENGPIPDGLFVLHSCDNRICTNPAHLFLGSNAANMADMARKGRNGRKLNLAQARQIKAALNGGGQTHKEIARDFGVTRSCVQAISSGRLWHAA